ncbi:MAG: DUF739 domain-containing protein [Candidatus Limiplasma sp.]|nr:DUF739 domain-containing protein [Candidatus Limiplasma sp.]
MNRTALIAAIKAAGLTHKALAPMIGITPKTFCLKLKRGEFTTTEAARMVKILHIRDPSDMFLTDEAVDK